MSENFHRLLSRDSSCLAAFLEDLQYVVTWFHLLSQRGLKWTGEPKPLLPSTTKPHLPCLDMLRSGQEYVILQGRLQTVNHKVF